MYIDNDEPLIQVSKDPLYELWMDKMAAESLPNAQAVVSYLKSRISSSFEGLYLDIYVKNDNNEDHVIIDYFQASNKLPANEVMKSSVYVKIKISADTGFRWISGTSVPDRIRAIPISPIPNIPTFRKRSGKPLNVLKSTVEYFIANQSILKTPMGGDNKDLLTPSVSDEDAIQNPQKRKINYIEGNKPKSQVIDTTISVNRTPDGQGFHPWTRSDKDLLQTLDALVPGYKLKINNQEFPIYEVKKVEKTQRGLTVFIASPSDKALLKKVQNTKTLKYISRESEGLVSSMKVKK